MQRCLQLAALGEGKVAPNPLVGAVLVHHDRIIGEGYHEHYGQSHAEVNCINSVAPTDQSLISESTLYVSLEPCSHFGKTPPCSDLIIKHRIPHVVIGCRDSFEKVNGSGIEKLNAAGITTETGILEAACRAINKKFFTFHEKKRPYIILKWAQSSDGKIAGENGIRTKISNDYTDRLVHKWRSEEAAIFVGTNTIINDDPSLTVRHWNGNNPVRVIVDNGLKTNLSAKIFDGTAKTIVINKEKETDEGGLIFFKAKADEKFEDTFVRCMKEHQLNSVLVEGGAMLLQSFIDADLWDEARIITNVALQIGKGIAAPKLRDEYFLRSETIFGDRRDLYKKNNNEFL